MGGRITMKKTDYRVERDSIGVKDIPEDVYYGVQSLRAAENFHITGLNMHPEIINSLAYIKKAAAITNCEVGLLDKKKAQAIVQACDEIVSGLILEFRRGTLIMVVLAQLNKPMYGYSLVKELEGKGISIEGNTLYPLLRRLESQGLLKSEWETEATKPRKYYIITEDGKLVYKKIKEHWKKFSQSINVLMEEE